MLVALVLRGLYSYLDAYENRHQPAAESVGAADDRGDTRRCEPGDITEISPAAPGKQTRRTEINDFRMQEEQTLNSYGWVDQQAGVVRIPIDRAMQLLAQRGLPTRPQAGDRAAVGCEHGERSGAAVGYEQQAGDAKVT